MRSPAPILGIAFATLGVAVSGCQPAPEPVAPARSSATAVAPKASVPAKPSAPSKPSAKAPPSSSDASSAEAPPPPEPPSAADRVRTEGSTRGRIQCGEFFCSPGKEQCSLTPGAWKCDTRGAEADVSYECDDGTDCPNGETCCLSFTSATDAYVCSPRRGPKSDCRLEICAEGGARCPKGQVCRDRVCRAPDRAATCEGIGRCPLDRPICRWSAKSTRCVDWKSFESETDEDRHALRCTRPNDCGSEARCCTNAIWDSTACLTNCDSANNGEVCASDADCTTFLGKPMKGKCVSVKDGEIATLPAWLKVCSYE